MLWFRSFGELVSAEPLTGDVLASGFRPATLLTGVVVVVVVVVVDVCYWADEATGKTLAPPGQRAATQRVLPLDREN